MKTIRVHRLGFFEPKPESIRCLSYDEASSYLAVSRSDSSIEIWDVKENPFLEKVIPSCSLSVETLVWCNSRLFSSGLDGYIVEHDLNSLSPKYQLIVTSGCPIWCMKPNKKKKVLAVGNEDGHVVLHELASDGLNFDKKFDKQEGCILCIDWSHNDEFIVTGSIDAIRIWNVESGHAINRIMLSRSSKNTPTIVWCLAVLRDMTIVSGDSCGKTSFWDGLSGTLLSANGTQKEDILSLTVSENEEEIYTSGVDPTITAYMKAKSSGKWMKSTQRVVHTHDVRALQLVREFLASGGDDCNLVFTKFPPKTTITYFPFCQRPYATTASKASCILLQYPDCLKLFGLKCSTSHEGEVINPENLLKIVCKTGRIVCSSISDDGKYIAYSSQHKLKLFSIKMNNNFIPEEIHCINISKKAPQTAKLLSFTLNSRLICYSENKFFIISCDNFEATVEAVHENDPVFSGDCHLMETSPNDLYLACASHNGSIIVYSLAAWEVVCRLPLYKCQATALKFDPSSQNLTAVYSDRTVIEYNLKTQKYTSWSKQNNFHKLQTSSHHSITSICFVANNLILQDENSIYYFNMEKNTQPTKRHKNSDGTETFTNAEDFKTITKYEHTSSIHSICDDLVVVQINANSVLDSLPPPIWKKKYGT